jgi:hypothetical protein
MTEPLRVAIWGPGDLKRDMRIDTSVRRPPLATAVA